MKNIFIFLSKAKLALVLIILLLIVQAYCDLALPTYTSDLLNVSLQQGGIEDAVPDTIREESLSTLELFLSDEDTAVVEDAYDPADADGIRAFSADADRDTVNSILTVPACIVYQMSLQDESAVDQLSAAVSAGMMTKEAVQEQMADVTAQMEVMTDTYLNEIAVYYVSGEYEAQGLDLNAIRNHSLMVIGIKMLLMAFVMMVAAIFIGLLASTSSARISADLRKQAYKKVMEFTNGEMEKFSTASLITRATNDIQQVQMVIVMLLRIVAYAPIIAIGGIIMVVQSATGMSWIIVLAVIILAACVGVLFGIAMPKFRQMQKKVDRVNLVSREMLSGIMPIRAFNREKYEEARFDVANQELYKTQLFANRTMNFMNPVMMFVMNGISALIVWVGAHGVDAGTMQVGNMTAFITYSMVIVMGFMMIAMISIMLPRACVAADRIMEVIRTPLSLQDPENPQNDKLADAKGVLEFHDVSFTYPGSDEPAISNISFTAEPGKTTAIVGSTGCGKSTIINLIPRFYDVTSGSITMDGVDIRDITQEKLRRLLGYVPQKGTLFSGTIESNLKYGGDFITDEDIEKAAEIAQATEFISEKPDGFQSPIAQGGSNVSGGQKQRLSIARAIALHPKVFLFDDSFSALDYKTDLALRQALARETGGATVIIVAQRISTVLHADQIIVLESGQIVGAGTHEELLASCETYQEIARSQLSEAELAGTAKGGNA